MLKVSVFDFLVALAESTAMMYHLYVSGLRDRWSRCNYWWWQAVSGTVRYEVWMNISRSDYDFTAPGSLLERYTKLADATTNNYTLTTDLSDRWTYKWYIIAVDSANATKKSNTLTFSIYLPVVETVAVRSGGVAELIRCLDQLDVNIPLAEQSVAATMTPSETHAEVRRLLKACVDSRVVSGR